MDLVPCDLVAATLSARELQVAAALLEARSNSNIAQLLGVRERTVKAHIQNMSRKAGLVRDRSRILLVLVLLGIPRLKKNRIRLRPSLLRGFRAPGGATRSMRMRARDARSQPVAAGCSRIAPSRPAPGGAVAG